MAKVSNIMLSVGWGDRDWTKIYINYISTNNHVYNNCSTTSVGNSHRSEDDNFGGRPETFCWFFFNFMFMIWDSRHEDLQLFWLSFKHWELPGGRINIKMSSYQYRKSHCGDKTILRPSYLHNGISYTDKMTSLYWIRAQGSICFFRVWGFPL